MLQETKDNKTPMLILANKSDLQNAENKYRVWDTLALDSEKDQSRIRLQQSSGKTGEGLEEGFGWLVDTINSRN